jgi:hypothetical protein
MMKKLLFTLMLFAFATLGYAQNTWNYNFGSTTGTFNIALGTNVKSSSDLSPDLNVPSPTSAVARLRLSSATPTSPGLFELVNTGTTFSGSQLKITGPTTSSSNKFSIYNIPSSATAMSLSYNLKFNSGTDGTQVFSIGNDSGAGTTGDLYSNSSNTLNQAFTSLRWELKSGGTAHTFKVAVGGASTLVTLSPSLNPIINNFLPNSEHFIQIFCNNASTASTYYLGSTTYSIGANSWQMWVDGTQILLSSGVADFGATSLSSGSILNAFMYLSYSTTTSAATYLDNFIYSDNLPNVLLPVKLISFTVKAVNNQVSLNWQTTSEVNLSNYVVQRSINGQDFETLASLKAKNTAGVFDYSFVDYTAKFGVNYYRLISVDIDGKSISSNPVAVTLGASIVSVTAYPNPAVNQLNVSGLVIGDRLKLLDLSGRIIKTQNFSGSNTAVLNLDKINAGVYLLVVENAGKLTFQSKIVKN